MAKIPLNHLWVGLSLCVLSASVAYDTRVVGEVLAAGPTEWAARRIGSNADSIRVAMSLARKPARTSAAVSCAFGDDKVRVHAAFQIALGKGATPAFQPLRATVALAWEMSRWI